ncbi:MAG: 16S rRNA (guanine(527)-N(7))-methyltransferase RsmG [Coriobacteriales bacterium]|jgi:16S rRNA (guanine527-N7)-methyltransferase|nr:16S rRNA (guanine(527)-N(7))-methyltransferase RsmG [Coriobacteriales bacterium]
MNPTTLQRHIKEALGCSISKEQAGLLFAHLSFIVKQNEALNLTSIRDLETGAVLHVEDSLAALPEIEAAPDGGLVDLGSGAGFPGIPLALMTTRKSVLVEARAKKARILQSFVQRHAFDGQIAVEALRIEDYGAVAPEQFAVATARALGSLPVLMELAAPLLQVGGLLVAYKARLSEEEWQSAVSVETVLGMKTQEPRTFLLSDGTSQRSIVRIVKQAESKISLPRRVGKAQKRPLA